MARATTTPKRIVDEQVVERLVLALDDASTDDEREPLVAELVRRTAPVAELLARRYAGRGVETQDLEQVARTALVVAVTRYRRSVGDSFLAFAVPTITGELKRYFRDSGWSVRPPRRVQEVRAEISGAEEGLRHRFGREPSRAELAAEIGVEVPTLLEARSCGSGYHPASLDEPCPVGGTVGAGLADERADSERWATVLVLRSLLGELPAQDRRILRLRYEDGLTQVEIGKVVGISQVQVSRRLSRVVRLLRAGLTVDAA